MKEAPTTPIAPPRSAKEEEIWRFVRLKVKGVGRVDVEVGVDVDVGVGAE